MRKMQYCAYDGIMNSVIERILKVNPIGTVGRNCSMLVSSMTQHIGLNALVAFRHFCKHIKKKCCSRKYPFGFPARNK